MPSSAGNSRRTRRQTDRDAFVRDHASTYDALTRVFRDSGGITLSYVALDIWPFLRPARTEPLQETRLECRGGVVPRGGREAHVCGGRGGCRGDRRDVGSWVRQADELAGRDHGRGDASAEGRDEEDLPLEEVCRLARDFGYDGLELACWGGHFEVDKALSDPGYLDSRHQLLDKYGLECWAISNHLVGQAVCDHPIDERHQAILPARIWGDGAPEGVRQRAAAEMKDTPSAAAAFGVRTVVGFTGSSIWHLVAMFSPVPPRMVDRGYEDFAARWNPILDLFDAEGVRFAHEVHPSEIAYESGPPSAPLKPSATARPSG